MRPGSLDVFRCAWHDIRIVTHAGGVWRKYFLQVSRRGDQWAKSYNLSGSPTPTGRPVLFKRPARYTRAFSRPRSPVPRQSGMTILRPDLFSRRMFRRVPVSSQWRKVLRSLGDAKRRPGGAPQSADPLDGRKNLPQRHQLPGRARRSKYKKPIFYWVFPDGTALADQPMWK